MKNRYEYYKIKYKEYIILIKSGNFYVALQQDAIVLNDIFKYKLNISNNIIKVGFPINTLNKILKTLDNININYIVLDKNILHINKNKTNAYNKYINNNISNYILRIKNINNILNQNIYNNIDNVLDNIENIIYNI
ncbi:MAG: hypothetical protein IJZ36_01795 [Bacilli bacterium]|nr:hypothetical protein [Bacilli bacterium]